MRRREFITLVGGTAAWPFAARAQQSGKVWRIGFLAGGARPAKMEGSVYSAFLRGMRELGYAENRDFIVEWRVAGRGDEVFFPFSAELGRRRGGLVSVCAPAAHS